VVEVAPVQHQIEGEDHHAEHRAAQHRELPAQLHRAALPPPHTALPGESSAPAPVGGGTAATALLRRGSPERSPEKCEKSPPALGTERRPEPRAAAGGEPAVSGNGSGSGCTRRGSGGGGAAGPRERRCSPPLFLLLRPLRSAPLRSSPPRHRQAAPESGTFSLAPRPERRRRAHAPRLKEPPPASARPRRRRSAALRPRADGRCREQVTGAAPPPLPAPPLGWAGTDRTAPWPRGRAAAFGAVLLFLCRGGTDPALYAPYPQRAAVRKAAAGGCPRGPA